MNPFHQGYSPRRGLDDKGPPKNPPNQGPVGRQYRDGDRVVAAVERLTTALVPLANDQWQPSAAELANPPIEHRLPWPMTLGFHHPSRGWITRTITHRQELTLLAHGIDPRDEHRE